MRGFREQHRSTRPKSKHHSKVGEVVIVKDEQRRRNTWKLAVVKQLINDRDGVIRAAKLKTARTCYTTPAFVEVGMRERASHTFRSKCGRVCAQTDEKRKQHSGEQRTSLRNRLYRSVIKLSTQISSRWHEHLHL